MTGFCFFVDIDFLKSALIIYNWFLFFIIFIWVHDRNIFPFVKLIQFGFYNKFFLQFLTVGNDLFDRERSETNPVI